MTCATRESVTVSGNVVVASGWLPWGGAREGRALDVALPHTPVATEVVGVIRPEIAKVLDRPNLADAGFRSVAMTHQAIADEIGSVREMVTRTLGQLAEQGLVELSRAGVRLVDPDGLRALAQGEAPVGDKSR